MENWNPKYETLSRLDDSSLFLIRDRLALFLKRVSAVIPLKWPLNCFWLIRDLSLLGIAPMDYVENPALPPDIDAVTSYVPAEDFYLISLRRIPEDWESRSSFRRCHFTLAHELGHIFLEHMAIPDQAKSESWKKREDDEADEFASRLLMPEELVRSCRFASVSEMAAFFRVSESACYHRMNNLRLLDRLRLPPPVCPECGNRRISPRASWCRMCGASLGYTVPEEAAGMIRLPWRPDCPVCGSGLPLTPEDECPDCGQRRDNRCRAEYHQPRHWNPPDARFCEVCGAETWNAALARTPFLRRGMPLWDLFRSR